MRQKSATRDDLRRQAMWLTVDEPQLRPVIDEALDIIERTARAEFWTLAKEGWQIVDCKTDVAATDRAIAYAEQLKMYERALAKVGIPRSTAPIQSVRAQST